MNIEYIIAFLCYGFAILGTAIKNKKYAVSLLGASLAVLWVYVMAIMKGVF